MDKDSKKKALDLMIVLGGPKKEGDMEESYGKDSSGGELEKMLDMHPLSKLTDDECYSLAEALEKEMSNRGYDNDDDEDMDEEEDEEDEDY
jgi:hypothetical protein